MSGTPALAGETPAPAAPSGSAPASAHAAAAAPALKIDVAVPDRKFVVDEEVPFDVTISNTGDADAKAVKAVAELTAGSPFRLNTGGFGKFAGDGDAVAAGKSTLLHLKGSATEWKDGDAKLTFRVFTPDDTSSAGATKDVTVKLVPTTAKSTVTGVFYGDTNDNGELNAGEGLANVTVKLTATSAQSATATATTDADGKFQFTDVPARMYKVEATGALANDWIAPNVQVVAVDGTNRQVTLRAAKPISTFLKATAKFDDGPYRPGNEAHLTITLVNSGTRAVEHVVASCDAAGSGWHLKGHKDAARWGELVSGATVNVGETRVFKVSGIVPDDAINSGIVYITCQFGPADGQYASGFPKVFTLAKVPGKNGSFVATLYNDANNNSAVDDGEAVPNIDVVLHDPLTGAEVTRAKTDAAGLLKFENIPACWYIPELSGGWRLKDNGFMPVNAKDTQHWALQVVQKNDAKPRDDTQGAPTEAKNVQTTNLANTGVDVTGPAITGFALLALGVGAVLSGRRRVA
ncbi:SdrD B-like domain-containing protein [Actinocrispum sp. NPDC049592]|uniref:SdrD B-like domain-containing protein n=1 Tax=Actinocrispum sp. NPDC049592 TaxID=3154835 RepID=UPI00343D67BC